SFHTNNLGQLTVNQLRSANFDPSFFEEAYEKDEVIFLFDGLDEVTNKNVRQEIIEWLLDQNTGKNPMLITTRQLDTQDVKNLTIRPTIYTLKEFDSLEIEESPKNWLKNMEIKMTKATSAADTRKIHLSKIIRENESLPQKEKNPLRLSIIAMLQTKRHQLKWPMELHELYEECLKLVIELKYQNNSHVESGWLEEKVKNCIKYLSHIAFLLVKNNRREIEPTQIRKILPDDENQLDSCLNDMVHITGILYESAGKYGFSSVIFQEYLAARYFARKKSPKDILEYLDNDYHPEIFKLYANIAKQNHIQEFFDNIIKNLEKKEYWKQLSLWEDCLLYIPDKNIQNEHESTRYKIEIQFAKQVMNVLQQTPYIKDNDELIISLYAHYPLYMYAYQFINEAWNLFNGAPHPFVQSIANSILHACDNNTRADLTKAKQTKAELMIQLKNRINDFEKQKEKTRQTYIDFILQNSNTFPLIFASRKNILDFNYGLEKLKSGDLFLNYLILVTLENLVYMLNTKGLSKLLNLSEFRQLLDFLDVQRFLEKLNLPVDIDLLALRDFMTLHDFMELRIEMGDIRIFTESKYFETLRGLVSEYESKYRSQLENLKKEINSWTDNATAKLVSLPDEKLLLYFPGTTKEDIKIFRRN
ncbi:MAG: hypothetical protein JSV88_09700, partial [Candidatus Aminicenantes bacterium]